MCCFLLLFFFNFNDWIIFMQRRRVVACWKCYRVVNEPLEGTSCSTGILSEEVSWLIDVPMSVRIPSSTRGSQWSRRCSWLPGCAGRPPKQALECRIGCVIFKSIFNRLSLYESSSASFVVKQCPRATNSTFLLSSWCPRKNSNISRFLLTLKCIIDKIKFV